MAWTTDDLDRIEKAIATGALLVSFRDRKVRYLNLSDLIKTRNIIWNTLQAAKGNPPPCVKTCVISTVSDL